MRIALITNIREGKGLYRDAVILERLLRSWGHETRTFDFREFAPGPYQLQRDHLFTVVIHLEVVQPRAFSWSDKQVWIPNPDWTTPKLLAWADAFRVVCAKTYEGERVLKEAGVKRVVYTGFESEDRMLEGVKRERVFFHSWGASMVKGTRSVLRAWDLLPEKYPSSFLLGSKLPEDAYRREQNRCLFWIQPSSVEGYGHIIHEGLSCGAVVATLDAPPMNEASGIARLIPARKVARQNLADVYEARPEAIAKAAEEMWEVSKPMKPNSMVALARNLYLSEREDFRVRFRRVLEEAL